MSSGHGGSAEPIKPRCPADPQLTEPESWQRGDFELMQQTPGVWQEVSYLLHLMFIQVVPCTSLAVFHWVGRTSAWDRHSPEKSPGGHFNLFEVILRLTKIVD